MNERCPDARAWQALLEEDASDDGMDDLCRHLESCPSCQHTMETVAGSDAWHETARTLSPQQCTLVGEAALRMVMDRLKEEGAAVNQHNIGDVLPYLRPADGPDLLGHLGPYEIREVIGRGGMGVVLKGFDPVLRRLVAIKVLAPHLASSGAARKRFVAEARAAAAITHDHVLTIHGVDDSVPYLVMPFVSGPSLQQKLDLQGPLSVPEILRIGMQTASGLAAAHAQGLIHRDVKPANIMLENGLERVKITDFGLARAADDASSSQDGVVAGTPEYMAPEQARGEPLDYRADLFSLGSVLYALCTGRPPFRGASLMILRRISDEPPPIHAINSEIPDWLEAIVMRLLAKRPNDRFASASEIAALLEARLAHVQNPPVRRKNAFAAFMTGITVAILLVGTLAITEATGITSVINAVVTTLRIHTPHGVLVVQVDDPQAKITIDGKELLMTAPGPREIHLPAGQYRLRASKPGVPAQDEIITIKQGGKEVVRVRLEAPATNVAEIKPAPRPTEGKIFEQPIAIWGVPDMPPSCGVFSPDDKTLVTGLWPGSAVLWDVATGKKRATLRTASNQLRAVAVSPDNKVVATGTADGIVRLWDNATGDLLQEFTGHARQLHGLAFSPDGTTLASCGGNWKTPGELRLWDLKTGKPRLLLPAQQHQVRSVAYAPSGKEVALALAGTQVALVSTTHGKTILTRELRSYARCVAYSPDGKLVAVAHGEDGQVRVLDAKLEEVVSFQANLQPVFALAFIHEGKRLLTSGVDGTAVIWEVDRPKARRVATFLGHKGTVYFAALSHDGNTLATGAGDRTIRLWNVASLQPRDAEPKMP